MWVKSYDHLNFSRVSVVHCWASRYIMDLIHTPESKVTTVWICQELLCSISSVSTYYAPESDIPVKSYDHLNFSRASVVHCRACRDISWAHTYTRVKSHGRLNMSRASVFNFQRVYILCARIGHPSEKLGPFEILESFRCSLLSVPIYHGPCTYTQVKSHGRLNMPRASIFNFEGLYILCAWIRHPSEKLWPFEFLERFRCSLSSVQIYHGPRTYTRVKSYSCLNFAGSFRVKFRASWYIMRLNQTFEWNVMTILIYRELLLFNFERIDISWASNIHLTQRWWPFEFANSFLVQIRVSRYITGLNHTPESKFMAAWICLALPCLILSVSIYYGPESDIWVKSYGRLSLTCASMFNFKHLDILLAWIGHPSQNLWMFEFAGASLFNFERLDIL